MTNENPHRIVADAAEAVGSIQQTQITSPSSDFQAPSTIALARQSAESFLSALDPGANRFTFQTFTDCVKKREAQKAKGECDPLARVLHGSLDCWDKLIQLSAAGAGIFVVINETDFCGRAANNIVRARSYFVDLDGTDLANLKRLALRPHLVVQTSNAHYHAYWLVDGAVLDQFRSTQQRLARLTGGDLSVCDLPRVMRLPGFPHQKNPARPFLVTFYTVEREPPYLNDDFLTALSQAEQGTNATAVDLAHKYQRRNIAETLINSLGTAPPDMTQSFPDGQRTTELTKRAGWCMGPWEMNEQQAIAACLKWNRHNTPPLTDKKVCSTVISIAKAEAKNRSADNPQQTAGHMDESTRDPTQRDKLILIGLDADLWHDKDGNTFATVTVDEHRENFSIKSTAFRHWLTHRYGERYSTTVGGKECPTAPSTQALTEATNALNAKAIRGDEHQTAVRVAGHGELIYLDLGTPDWRAVEISSNEWRVVSKVSVRFIRPPGLRQLPEPVKGAKSRSRKSAQDDKWSFCLTAGTLCAANQERP